MAFHGFVYVFHQLFLCHAIGKNALFHIRSAENTILIYLDDKIRMVFLHNRPIGLRRFKISLRIQWNGICIGR